MQTHLVLNAPSPSVASFGLSIKLLSQFGFFLLECPWQIGMLARNTYVIIPHDTEFYSLDNGDTFILSKIFFVERWRENKS